jgi:hypothetical protein
MSFFSSAIENVLKITKMDVQAHHRSYDSNCTILPTVSNVTIVRRLTGLQAAVLLPATGCAELRSAEHMASALDGVWMRMRRERGIQAVR